MNPVIVKLWSTEPGPSPLPRECELWDEFFGEQYFFRGIFSMTQQPFGFSLRSNDGLEYIEIRAGDIQFVIKVMP